jgi:hypothetical protein
MADDDYEEPDLTAEDPDLTGQGRWRWALPIVLGIVIPVAAIYALRETNGPAIWPSQNALLAGDAARHETVGTAGRAAAQPVSETDSPAVIREVETITGLVDRHPLVGREVDLHVPIAGLANDRAFWVGEKDNRLLVVPQRDRRTGAERQEGLLADNRVAPLETGKIAAISGSIQKLPTAEEMFGWGLTQLDKREVASMGVYLRADAVTVQ